MIFTRCLYFFLALPLVLASVIPRHRLATRDTIQSNGTYKITNVKAGNVVDLSGFDNKSIIGYPDHGGSNQRWTLEWTSGSWAIKSAGLGTYIGLDGAAANGTKLVAVSDVVTWDIWFDEVNPSNYRFFVHNTIQNWDLTDYGNSTPGNPIQTWAEWKGIHQTWMIEQQ